LLSAIPVCFSVGCPTLIGGVVGASESNGGRTVHAVFCSQLVVSVWHVPSGKNTQEHMIRFLRTHRGPLLVAAGYANLHGLSWMQQRTRGRLVTLVIGDTGRDRPHTGRPPMFRLASQQLIQEGRVPITMDATWCRAPCVRCAEATHMAVVTSDLLRVGS